MIKLALLAHPFAKLWVVSIPVRNVTITVGRFVFNEILVLSIPFVVIRFIATCTHARRIPLKSKLVELGDPRRRQLGYSVVFFGRKTTCNVNNALLHAL